MHKFAHNQTQRNSLFFTCRLIFFSLYLIINWSAANQKISLNHDIMKKKFYSASEMHMDEFMICSSGTGSGTEEPHWIRWKISTDLYISVTAARIRYLRGSLKSSQQTTSYMVISTFLLYLLYCCLVMVVMLRFWRFYILFFHPIAINCLFICIWYVGDTQKYF